MLTGVTISGADDDVDPKALFALSEEFPFVEWGILMSESRAGTPRYPTRRWMIGLENLAKGVQRVRGEKALRLSAHLCGAVARQALEGRLHPFPVVERTRRIQINGIGWPPSAALVTFGRMLPSYEIVLQVGAEERLEEAKRIAWAIGKTTSLLFDPSGGRGVEPFKWPWAPLGIHVGYAGGISPENVEQVVGEIAIVTSCDFWIDMESGVRTTEKGFDLARVRAVLEKTAGFIMPTSGLVGGPVGGKDRGAL